MKSENIYISIGEAANQLGVTASCLRIWEKKGYLKSFKTAGGHRRYTRESVDNLCKQLKNC